jgi:hypothetical protein
MSTLKTRIAALAGRVVLGAPIRQPERVEAPAKDDKPPVDAVAEARRDAEAFTARLRELLAARDAFDAAVAAERSAANFDLAGAVARGEELPDPGDVVASRSRAEIRLKALWQLANRECEGAALAVHVLRVAALAEAKEARGEAVAWVVSQLPPVFDKPEELAAQSRIVREAEAARAALEKSPSLPLRKAELFGYQLPSFRIEALPAKPGIPERDGLDPEQVARDIERTMNLHAEAVRFRCCVLLEPAAAKWEAT